MNVSGQTSIPNSGGFDRVKYNHEYYLKNKEKLAARQAERYRIRKCTGYLNEYINTHLDEDLRTCRDELVKVDETDPEQYQRYVDLMKFSKMLMELKCIAAGLPQSEIDEICNLPI